MCDFPSWIRTIDGKDHWLTDEDVRVYCENKLAGEEIDWHDWVGHHAIIRVKPDVHAGYHREGFDSVVPSALLEDILAGKMDQIMLASDPIYNLRRYTPMLPFFRRMLERGQVPIWQWLVDNDALSMRQMDWLVHQTDKYDILLSVSCNPEAWVKTHEWILDQNPTDGLLAGNIVVNTASKRLLGKIARMFPNDVCIQGDIRRHCNAPYSLRKPHLIETIKSGNTSSWSYLCRNLTEKELTDLAADPAVKECSTFPTWAELTIAHLHSIPNGVVGQ